MTSTPSKLTRILPFLALSCLVDPAQAATIPTPLHDAPLSATSDQTIVLAGGCFWGIEAVFEHMKGVKNAVSGYAGGAADDAHYDMVSSGKTGHAEVVQITYDPAVITPGQIMKVFFAVAHNPTELNRQGPDRGTQYRSEIFYTTQQQQEIANDYIKQLDGTKFFSDKIVTKVSALDTFYPAEDYHQGYAERNPAQPYIVMHDLPKLMNLKKKFPELYISRKSAIDKT